MVVVKSGNNLVTKESPNISQDVINSVSPHSDYAVRTGRFLCPPLEELSVVLSSALNQNFSQSSVTMETCPNLTKAPFNLASEGICGSCRIVEVGSPAFLAPSVDRSKKYNISKVASECGLANGFAIGASAGPWFRVGTNCEMIADANCNCKNGIHNKIAQLDEKEACHLFEDQSGDFALLGNFLLSSGKPGKVLHIKALTRTSEKNFITILRRTLADHYERPVGLGGVFLVKKGNIKAHIMPDFSDVPLEDPEVLLNWHKFFEFQSPLTCCSVIVSKDFDNLDLRLEHSHFFSDHGQGGHYHFDVTPEEVEYEGFFVAADMVYRLDQPVGSQKNTLGRFDGNHH